MTRLLSAMKRIPEHLMLRKSNLHCYKKHHHLRLLPADAQHACRLLSLPIVMECIFANLLERSGKS